MIKTGKIKHGSENSHISLCTTSFEVRPRKIMTETRNLVALIVSILGGSLLIVSGTRGPIGIYELILQKLPLFTSDTLVLTVAALILLFLIVMSSLGGFAVIFGGYLIYRNHVVTGKLTIGLGAGVGIPWLLFMLFTIMATQELTSVITQHSAVGWTGIILSFIARYVAKTPRHGKPKKEVQTSNSLLRIVQCNSTLIDSGRFSCVFYEY